FVFLFGLVDLAHRLFHSLRRCPTNAGQSISIPLPHWLQPHEQLASDGFLSRPSIVNTGTCCSMNFTGIFTSSSLPIGMCLRGFRQTITVRLSKHGSQLKYVASPSGRIQVAGSLWQSSHSKLEGSILIQAISSFPTTRD